MNRHNYSARQNAPAPKRVGYRPDFRSSAELAEGNFERRWLVDNIWVAGQLGVIGGPPKSLKTSIALDLAISLGSATPFLGKFGVPQQARVAFLTGESDAATIKDTALRICEARGIDFAVCETLWSFNLPSFSSSRDISNLAADIRRSEIEVVFVDPSFVCLTGGGAPIASNVCEMGAMLFRACGRILKAGATPILTYPARKEFGSKIQGHMDLHDLSFVGVAECARQWLLLSRSEPFDPSQGRHELDMNIGGNAGHGGLWRVTVREGVPNQFLRGRQWEATVTRKPDNVEPKRLPSAKSVPLVQSIRESKPK